MEKYSQELKDEMYQHLFKKGNTQTLNKLNEDRDKNKYPYFNKAKREVEQVTLFLSEDIDFNARIYCIENEIHEHPTCLYCGGNVKWNKTHKSFPSLCSASCKNYYRHIDRIKENISNNRHSKPLFDVDTEWRGVSHIYNWKCKHCGIHFRGNALGDHFSLCPECFPKEYKGVSNIEMRITDLLDKYNINYERNKRFYIDKGKNKELDVYIPDKNIGIEINGVYWHSEISGGRNSQYHLLKTLFFKDYFGIDVLHLLNTEIELHWDTVKYFLLDRLGIYSDTIPIKDTHIKRITKNVADNFLKLNHIKQFYHGSSIFYGLYHQQKLVQVLSTGKSKYKNYDYEIHRMCTLKGLNILGGFEKLFNQFIEDYTPKKVVIFVDRRYENEEIYKRNSFVYVKNTDPAYYYTKEHRYLYSSSKYQKHKLHNLLEDFNSELSEWENMKNNGFDRIWDCGNMVFVWGAAEEDIDNNEKQIDYFHKPEHDEEPRKEGYYYCEVCKRNMKSLKGLKKHLTMAHPEIDRKEYYNNYLKPEDESTQCPYCGKEKTFDDRRMFYWGTCGSKECVNQLNSDKVREHHNSYTRDEWDSILDKRKVTNLKRYGTEWAIQSEEVRETRRKNNIEKFGVENNSQTQEWRDKVVGKKRKNFKNS